MYFYAIRHGDNPVRQHHPPRQRRPMFDECFSHEKQMTAAKMFEVLAAARAQLPGVPTFALVLQQAGFHLSTHSECGDFHEVVLQVSGQTNLYSMPVDQTLEQLQQAVRSTLQPRYR